MLFSDSHFNFFFFDGNKDNDWLKIETVDHSRKNIFQNALRVRQLSKSK